ncbi:hypothetical protein ACFC1T_09520 [Kitasatospora sp. NPDC056076]|uniref:hypothetical protein n=1 Tax=Kitasatospora sp. NPDC056076 TaxID=3345703 RepID=UPI0035DE6D40
MLDPRRGISAAQAVIAVGVASRGHTFTTPPEETHGAVHVVLWVAIILVLLLAITFAAHSVGTIDVGPSLYEVSAAIYLGITLMFGLDQHHAPVDRQVANWCVIGGLVLLNLALWNRARTETEIPR